MEQIMDLLENKHSWKDVMRKCCRTNKLNIELASAFTPLRFRAAYARFKAMYLLFHPVTSVGVRIRENGGYKINWRPSSGWLWLWAAHLTKKSKILYVFLDTGSLINGETIWGFLLQTAVDAWVRDQEVVLRPDGTSNLVIRGRDSFDKNRSVHFKL